MPRKRPAARALTAIRRWITGAPGTYTWLTLLLVTTVLAQELPAHPSTHIHQLLHEPLRVLLSGALRIDGGHWLLYAALFTVFHATAEHWLGTPRWLTVAAAAQFLAPFVTAAALTWAVRHGHAPPHAAHTLDTGPGYALAGVAAVLTYRVPHPWRALYAFAVLVAHAVPLVSGRTFAELGHFTAVLTGLACYPLVRASHRAETERAPAQ